MLASGRRNQRVPAHYSWACGSQRQVWKPRRAFRPERVCRLWNRSPGHGKSEGQRVFIKTFEEFIRNLKTYLEMIRDWQSGKPVFLFGHSMGGLIGAIFLLEFQEELKGAILSGPGVKIPENISSGTILAGKMLSILMPRFGLDPTGCIARFARSRGGTGLHRRSSRLFGKNHGPSGRGNAQSHAACLR